LASRQDQNVVVAVVVVKEVTVGVRSGSGLAAVAVFVVVKALQCDEPLRIGMGHVGDWPEVKAEFYFALDFCLAL
jgi:hypothetical protein